MIKAILFDIDGTLVDSNELHVQAWAQIFSETEHRVDDSAIRGQIGKGGDNLVPALLPDLSKATVQALSDGHDRIFRQVLMAEVKPFPHAAALLRRVADEGQKVVLATSASDEELRHYVDLLGVRGIVSATTSKDDVKTSKPAPDIFAAALKAAHVSADEAIAVGDTPFDVEAAAKAGIGTVAVLSGGFSEAALRTAGANAIFRDAADLLARYAKSPLAR